MKKGRQRREVDDLSEQRSLLVWLPEIKRFMSVQPGIGDNLEPGCDDYFLYTILKPVTVDACDELTLKDVDGGQLDIENGYPYTEDVIDDILEFHFSRKMEYMILLAEDDLQEETNNKKGNRKMAKTTVRCPKCGTAFEIPAKEVLGIVGNLIGENSGLGDVYLKEKEGEPCKPLRDKDGRFVSRSNGISLAGEEYDNDGEHNDDEPLCERVRKQGHVKNHRLFRRWIMAQMFHTLLAMKNWNEGFARLVRNRGLRYMWKVVKNELHDMRAIMRNGDEAEYARRDRWWNTGAVYEIACSFALSLEKEIGRLKVRKCKGREYVTVPGFGMVFQDEVRMKILAPLHERIDAFTKCNCQRTADALCDFASQFKDSSAWKLGMPTEFIDRFKGAGAYFTLRNMLMFHGCRLPYEVAQKFGKKDFNLDLDLLDLAAEEYKDKGWQLLGLLKDTIKFNGIDVEEKIRSWKKD